MYLWLLHGFFWALFGCWKDVGKMFRFACPHVFVSVSLINLLVGIFHSNESLSGLILSDLWIYKCWSMYPFFWWWSISVD
jgi:hypothetical protein